MLLSEFDHEMAGTRKILESLPEDKFDWKPHSKSFTLGKLANHVAGLCGGPVIAISGRDFRLPEATSKAGLLGLFDTHAASSREALAGVSDERLAKAFRVTPETSRPLASVLRSRVMNHLIHHRGQLSVYLRLLDVPVPGMYGASADEKS